MTKPKRLKYLDFLRGYFIVAAIVIHFSWTSDFPFSQWLHIFHQNTVIISEFFVFISGVMAYNIYRKKYQAPDFQNKMTKKATRILLYLFLVMLSYFISEKFLINQYRFASFTLNNILFTFFLIFITTPTLLKILNSKYRLIFVLATTLAAGYFLTNEVNLGTYNPKILTIGYGIGRFSAIPYLELYIIGYFAAKGLSSSMDIIRLTKQSIPAIFTALLIYLNPSWLHHETVLGYLLSISIMAVLIPVTRYVYEKKYQLPINIFDYLEFIGKNSLLFFTTGNILIYLSPRVSGNQLLSIFLLTAILVLSYKATRLSTHPRRKHLKWLI